MSNHLAIATVTAALQRILQAAIQIDVDGARATTNRPSEMASGMPEPGVNVYLYDIKHNHAWRSTSEMLVRRGKGEMVKPRLGIDLYYLLSFHGNEGELEPQRLLGSVISALQDKKILTQQMISDTIGDDTFPFLAGSNLAQQVELVKILLLDLSLEDLSKIWSVFFQTAYSLSIAYQATAVLIEGEDIIPRALPVRDRHIGARPFSLQPVIESIVSQAGKLEPILADSTLLIYGKQLSSRVTQVRLGEVEATPQEVRKTQIRLELSSLPADSLRAGVQSLQVIHQVDNTAARQRDAMAATYQLIESNVAAFVLRPTIKEIEVSNMEGSGEELRSADLTISIDVPIGMTQRVILLLNEWSIESPAAYSFVAPSRTSDSNALAIAIKDVKPGSYLVRLQVDGAESMLNVDTNPNSRTFNWYLGPKVSIS